MTRPSLACRSTGRIRGCLLVTTTTTRCGSWNDGTIFANAWFCLGRSEEIPNAGDYISGDVAGTGVLVVRGKDEVVRAFYNVCRHRGSELCDPGVGSTKGAFSCPYHNWVYDLDGTLIGTPNVRAGDDFDRSQYPLKSVACDVWDGMVFVNLSANPQPLREQLADEPDGPLDYERYRLGELRLGKRIVYEVEANWKSSMTTSTSVCTALVCILSLSNIVPMFRKGMVFDPDRPDLGVNWTRGINTFTMSGTVITACAPGLTEADHRTYWGYSVMPNVAMNLLSTGVMVYFLYPRGPGHTTIVSEYLFRPETVDDPASTALTWSSFSIS